MGDDHVADSYDRVIPTDHRRRDVESQLACHGEWFYRYRFSNGVETRMGDEETLRFHTSRARLMFPMLDGFMGEGWPSARCLDLACHEGWFAVQLALRGAKEVIGVDVRFEHVEKASVIRDLGALNNLQFHQADLFSIRPEEFGLFDVTLFLGVLYHLAEPMAALRLARQLTRGVCVIETQVARPAPDLECLWGSGEPRAGPGLALVEADEHHAQQGGRLVIVPTLAALSRMLYSVGFQRLELSVAGPSFHPQYQHQDRVLLFAHAV